MTYERSPDNWYIEPGWVSRRLFDVERFDGRTMDPCAGTGRIVEAGLESGLQIEGYDLRDRGNPAIRRGDFFDPKSYVPGTLSMVDNIVSNPPYGPHEDGGARLEQRFVQRALDVARRKVAVFVRATFIFGQERAAWLRDQPVTTIYYLTPRPSAPPGEGLMEGTIKASGGKHDYVWIVFVRGYQGKPVSEWLDRDEGTTP